MPSRARLADLLSIIGSSRQEEREEIALKLGQKVYQGAGRRGDHRASRRVRQTTFSLNYLLSSLFPLLFLK